MTLEILERTRLDDLAAAWDSLAATAPLPSPFLRSWWLEGTAGSRPLFVLVVEEGRLLGGIPLERDRLLGVCRLGFMGSRRLAPDHLDLVAECGREDAVVEALRAWFAARRDTVVDLCGVAETSRVATALPGPVRHTVMDLAPWTELPRDPAQYLHSRPAPLRNTIRRGEARLHRAGAVHREVHHDDAPRALAALRMLHETRWNHRSAFGRSFRVFAAAALSGMQRGEVSVHELVCGDRVVASTLMLEVAGRTSFYQSGRTLEREWRSAGTVLLWRAVSSACARGCGELDMLRGDEEYKRAWADRSRAVVRLTTTTGPRAWAALAATETALGLRHAAMRRFRRLLANTRGPRGRTAPGGD